MKYSYLLLAALLACSCSGKGAKSHDDESSDDELKITRTVDEPAKESSEESQEALPQRSALRVGSAWCNFQLNNQAGNNYHPRNMTDGNPATAWAAKMSEMDNIYDNGLIVGPVFDLASPSKISGVELQNGYCKNSSSFKNNTRAAYVTIYRYHPEYDGEYGEDQEAGFINKSDIIYEGPLKDTMSPQYFPVSAGFDNSQSTRAVGLIFHDGRYYYGNKWNDLCLSEIKVFGR